MLMESPFRCKIKSFQFSIQFETTTKPFYATSKCENTHNHVTLITGWLAVLLELSLCFADAEGAICV